MAIKYVEILPVVAIDGEGVGGATCSGDETSRWRCSRSLWRKFLETEIRRLNEWELAERAEKGRVLHFERRG